MKSLLACLSLALTWFVTPSVAAAKPTVAILGLEVIDDGSGLDVATVGHAKELTEALRRRPRAGGGPYLLVPGGERDLAELKFIRNCETEAPACMGEIGEELGAAFLIYGRLEKRPGGVQVTLKLFGVSGKQLMKSTTELIPAADLTATELERASRTLYGKLTGTAVGTQIMVSANVATGRVLVDGVAKGELENGRTQLTGVPNGRREIAIESPGYILGTQVVTVKSGADLDLEFTLTKTADDVTGTGVGPGGGTGVGPGGSGPVDGGGDRPGGGYRVAFWAGAALTAGAAVVWGYHWNIGMGAKDDLESRVAPTNASNDEIDRYVCNVENPYAEGGTPAARQAAAEICKDANAAWPLMWVGAGLTAAFGAVTAYSLYRGYLSSGSSESSRTATRRSKRSPVAITPVLSPGGAGATVRIDF